MGEIYNALFKSTNSKRDFWIFWMTWLDKSFFFLNKLLHNESENWRSTFFNLHFNSQLLRSLYFFTLTVNCLNNQPIWNNRRTLFTHLLTDVEIILDWRARILVHFNESKTQLCSLSNEKYQNVVMNDLVLFLVLNLTTGTTINRGVSPISPFVHLLIRIHVSESSRICKKDF